MTENEFILFDRIEKIKAINDQYDLLNNAYLSFSGGKDSTILHKLIDLALPNNKIPRLFLNTGIEYIDMVKYVRSLADTDERIIIYNSGVNIPQMLNKYGYPFKSKEHSHYLGIYQHSGIGKSVKKYLKIDGSKKITCPHNLKYQFTPEFHIKINDTCCIKLKKKQRTDGNKKTKKALF